jgi:hypothetical protein
VSIVIRPSSITLQGITDIFGVSINPYAFAVLYGLGAGLLLNGKVSQALFNLATLPMALFASVVCAFSIFDPRSTLPIGIFLGGYWLTLQVLHWRLAVSDGERNL